MLKTGNNEKSSRLVHYTGIIKKVGRAGGEVGNGKHNRNNCPSHRSHDLYPGPSSV